MNTTYNDPQVAVAEWDLSRRTSTEYKSEIVEHMIALDKATRPDASMIDMQPEIEWQMWSYLVDFMIDVHAKLKLEPQTLFMAVNIVNRYCARRIVFRKHFQLVGCTALWIAAKYEDKKSRVPTLAVLSHMCCKAYQEEMFVQMEGHVLNTLDWTISHCTVDSFISVIIGHGGSPLLTSLASYLAELTLYHREFVGADPYVVARSIHLLTLHILHYYSNLGAQNLPAEEESCLELLCNCIKSPSAVLAEKYASMERFQASRLVANHLMKQEQQQAASSAHLTQTPPGYAPLTPPQSHPGRYKGGVYSFTPPHLSTDSCSSLSSKNFAAEDSPLTIRSYDKSVGIIETITSTMASSPPVTPLDPPKRPFAHSQV